MAAKVNVTFVDHSTDTVIGTVDLSPDALPPSFQQDTTLYIGDADWTVIEAQPATSAEFIKEGSLTLRLERGASVDPNNILFSVPSIFEMLPESGDRNNSGEEFQVSEDDWRQIELLSSDLEEVIAKEFSFILAIHENASQEAGWSNMHLRKEPLHPISKEDLSWSALCDTFPDAKDKGLSFSGKTTQIENAFSLELPSGFFLYGLKNEDQILVLGLDAYNTPSKSELTKLAAFASKNELLFVDWCRCNLMDGVEGEKLGTEFFHN